MRVLKRLYHHDPVEKEEVSKALQSLSEVETFPDLEGQRLRHDSRILVVYQNGDA